MIIYVFWTTFLSYLFYFFICNFYYSIFQEPPQKSELKILRLYFCAYFCENKGEKHYEESFGHQNG